MLTVIFKTLKEVEVTAHYEHLLTTSFAKHKALGKLYESIPDFADRLAEAILPEETLATPASLNLNWRETFEYYDDYLKSVRDMISTYERSYSNRLEIQNILSEIKELFNKTFYLFTLS